jgi:hypothetical protein
MNDNTGRFAVALIVASALAGLASAVIAYSQMSAVAPSRTAVSQKSTLPKHAVLVKAPSGPPGVNTGRVDMHGKPVRVRCTTCHAVMPSNAANRHGSDLDQFHQGLTMAHGNLSCLSCHNPDNYETLRLADGRAVEFADVMTLCAQCHGPQARDYAHGAHGGMTGHWDLTRGPRQRNNCIDCHDPHAPAFPQVRPVFAPKDRFPRSH